MPTRNTTRPKPPANAVAKDAHWADKLTRLQNRKRPTATLTICDDQDVKDRLAAAKRAHKQALAHKDAYPGKDADQLLADAEAALEQAQAVFDEVGIVLTFQALSRERFEELKNEHTPTEDQADRGEIVNVTTLGPILISETSVDGLTVDQAAEFLNTWSPAEGAELFHAAWDIQLHSRQDLGKG